MVRIIGLTMILTLVSCCHKATIAAKNNEKKQMITGEIGAFNRSGNGIGVGIQTGEKSRSFGFVGINAHKVMGFAQLYVGGQLEVSWTETFADGSQMLYTAIFDSKELADVAANVKGMKFTYLGKQEWTLEVFKAKHMKAPDSLKTIKCATVFEVKTDQ